jgi:hypothetical protein
MKCFGLPFVLVLSSVAFAQPAVYSGPQPGETIRPFRAFVATGPGAGSEVQALADAMEGAVAIVFVHNVERSLVPLLQVVDRYAHTRKERMKTAIVFLSEDRIAMEGRVPQMAQSIRLSNPAYLSLDGAEGPGSYGLNKDCLITIVAARDGKVTANFALVQPGIADAERVIAALAETSGDPAPPSVAQLQAMGGQDAPGMGSGRGGGMAPAPPLDLRRLDTSTPEATERTIRLLVAEIERLRAENQALRGAAGPNAPVRDLPGAPPQDPELVTLFRRFIQPTNTEKQADDALAAIEKYIDGKPPLRRETANALTLILHLKYGTEHAQRVGKAFLERIR